MPKSNIVLQKLLTQLHEQNDQQLYARARSQYQGTDEEFLSLAQKYNNLMPRMKGQFLKTHGLSSEDSDTSQGTPLSLAISEEMGKFLLNMVLSNRATRILELGSSYGVSTLYFAEALRLQGKGTVIATELDHAKCEQLRHHIETTNLSQYVELREGDVFKTVESLEGTFDIVFIDIWASGYLELFKKVERLLHTGSIILADNMYTAEDAVQPFKQYIDTHPKLSSTTLDFESGVEFAVVL